MMLVHSDDDRESKQRLMVSILSFPDYSVLDRKKTYPFSRKREEGGKGGSENLPGQVFNINIE